MVCINVQWQHFILAIELHNLHHLFSLTYSSVTLLQVN